MWSMGQLVILVFSFSYKWKEIFQFKTQLGLLIFFFFSDLNSDLRASTYRFENQFSSVQSLSHVHYFQTHGRMSGLPVHLELPKFTQIHVHWVCDTTLPSHPLLSPSPPSLNLSQLQGLFKWVSSSHQVSKVLEFQLQQQSFPMNIQDWFPLRWTFCFLICYLIWP